MKTSYELFGIECGLGWRKLYEPLIKMCEDKGIEIHQIKEKFGGLRFYTSRMDDELDSAIEAAEEASTKICEDCGEPGQLRRGGWIRTQCDECYADRPNRR